MVIAADFESKGLEFKLRKSIIRQKGQIAPESLVRKQVCSDRYIESACLSLRNVEKNDVKHFLLVHTACFLE